MLPPFGRSQKIGLFGGSFNPPHEGHLLLAQTALKRLGLDHVWWLVSPGNPLKIHEGLPPVGARCFLISDLVRRHGQSGAKFSLSDVEHALGSPFTYHTLCAILARARGTHFVWLMGADNLESFHRWQHWRTITKLMPICVIDRPDTALRATASISAKILSRHRVRETRAIAFARMPAPAFLFLHGPRIDISSTQLRTRQGLNTQKDIGTPKRAI